MWAFTIDMKLMADAAALAYRRAGHQVLTRTYYYHFPDLTVATINLKDSDTLLTDGDSLFCILALAHSKIHGAADTGPAVGVENGVAGCGLRITDLQNSYTFGEDVFVPSETIAGSGQAPAILGSPYLLAPGSRMRAEIVHRSGRLFSAAGSAQDTAITVRLTLIGIKIVTSPFTRVILSPEL